MSTPAQAEEVNVGQTVSIHVSSSMAVESSSDNLNFSFQDKVKSDHSDTQTVLYSIKSNGASVSSGEAALFAEVDEVIKGVDLQAKAGVFQREDGVTELQATGADFVTVSERAVALAKKINSEADFAGGRGVVKGSLPVAYRMVGEKSSSSVPQNQNLTVTFTSI